MSASTYNRQHLAVQAAGSINAAGTTSVAFGCTMTRSGVGEYSIILDDNSGVVDDDSFTLAQTEDSDLLYAMVEDVSNVVKTIHVLDDTATSKDAAVEVKVFKRIAE